jgi:hypothetical protein
MKPFRQLCATVIVTLSLALSTFAGQTPCGESDPPPPPPPQAAITPDSSTDSVTEIMMDIIQSILPPF